MFGAAGILSTLFLLTSCINEDLSDCGVDYKVEYNLKLVTNVSDEIANELTTPEEKELGAELAKRIEPVFQNYVKDIDLSFYNDGESLAHHESTEMDGSTATYTVYLPLQNYKHLAIANEKTEEQVSHHQTENLSGSHLSVASQDTIASQQIGLYSGRLPMQIEQKDQIFHVALYMVNAVEALVLNTNNQPVKSVETYVKDLATSFYVNDSTYTFERSQTLVPESFQTPGGKLLCYYGVGFPSRDVPGKSDKTIRAADADAAHDALWQMEVYVTLNDGKTTKSTLYVKAPLKAGQLKIIKAKIDDKGAVVADNQEVGVSVQLEWKPGGEYEGGFD